MYSFSSWEKNPLKFLETCFMTQNSFQNCQVFHVCWKRISIIMSEVECSIYQIGGFVLFTLLIILCLSITERGLLKSTILIVDLCISLFVLIFVLYELNPHYYTDNFVSFKIVGSSWIGLFVVTVITAMIIKVYIIRLRNAWFLVFLFLVIICMESYFPPFTSSLPMASYSKCASYKQHIDFWFVFFPFMTALDFSWDI